MSTLVKVATCNLNQWALDFRGNLMRIKESIREAKEQESLLLEKRSAQSKLNAKLQLEQRKDITKSMESLRKQISDDEAKRERGKELEACWAT